MAEVKTIKVGEPLTSNVDGNPDPSFLNTTGKEGVETRQWICLKCSNSFIPKTKRSKFCSTNCATAFNMQAWRLRHNKIEKPGVGSGNNQFETKNSQFKNGWTTYRRKGKELSQNKCNRCGSTSFLLIHHKNENREDSREENLEMLCKSCHQRHHETRDDRGRYAKKKT